jgi:hypothetical protein
LAADVSIGHGLVVIVWIHKRLKSGRGVEDISQFKLEV